MKNGFYPLVDITINHMHTYRETDKDVEGKEETEIVGLWECGFTYLLTWCQKDKRTTKTERGKAVFVLR